MYAIRSYYDKLNPRFTTSSCPTVKGSNDPGKMANFIVL